MALFYKNTLHRCEYVSKFARFRLPSAQSCCARFTTTASNVAWMSEKYMYSHKTKTQPCTSLLSCQRKCLSLQTQDSKSPLELLPLNLHVQKSRNVFQLYKSTRIKRLKVMKKGISCLEEWAKNPLIDHREVIAVSLRDYEKCLKSVLKSEIHIKNILQEPSQCKKQQKINLLSNWSSSRFGQAAVIPATFYMKKPARDMDLLQGSPQVKRPRNLDQVTSSDKEVKDKGKEISDKPNPTQLATVLMTLREEIPLFFVKSHCYEQYHRNMTFVNKYVGVILKGLTAYRMWLSLVKITSKLLMSDLSLDILKITKDSQDSTVKVRWRIRGIPRYQILLPVFSEKYSYIDGFSIFEVGKDGLIHCHRLDRVIPSSSREKQRPVWAMGILGLFGFLRQQSPAEVFEILDTIKSSSTENPAKRDIAGL